MADRFQVYNNFTVFSTGDPQYYVVKKEHIAFKIRRLLVTRGFFDLAADGVKLRIETIPSLPACRNKSTRFWYIISLSAVFLAMDFVIMPFIFLDGLYKLPEKV
jgi:hypothetical protein